MEVVCVVLVSLALQVSEVEAEAEGEGLKEGDVTAEEAGGAVEITVAVLLDVVSVVPVRERLVTAALVKGRTGLTVRVVAVLFVTRLGVVATSEVGLGKIALIGELLVPPLLGGFILFFLLAAVTKPNANHLLFHVELFSNQGDIFRGRLLILHETLL